MAPALVATGRLGWIAAVDSQACEPVAVLLNRLFLALNVLEHRRPSPGTQRLSVRRTRRLKRRSKPSCVLTVKIRTLPRNRYER